MVALLFTDTRPAAGDALGRVRAVAERYGAIDVVARDPGILVVLPSASEAVACGKELATATSTGPPSHDWRVGIHFGEVTGSAWTGPSVDTAARLAGAAEPGGVLVSNSVRHLVETSRRGQAFELVGDFDLTGGGGERSPVWAVVTGTAAGLRLPPLVTSIRGLPFRGRDAPMAELEAAWDRATAGPARLVLVAGEPGVGKTRLVAEFARRLHDRGVPVLAGRCDSEPVGTYQPLREALGHYVDAVGPAAITAVLSERTPLLARLVTELGPPPPLPPGDPDLQRLALFDAIAAILAHAGRVRPALVIVDDLHWADDTTVVLLRHLLRTIPPDRLLVAGTVREHELGPRHPLTSVLASLRGGDAVDRVDLGGLDIVALHTVIKARIGHDLDVRLRRVADELHRITEGNPFFLTQLLRHLVDTGFLRHADGRWHADRDPAELAIPDEVRDVVGRRVATLSPDCQQLLRAASVLGLEFDLGTVAEIVTADADTALEFIEEAMRWRVVGEATGSIDRFSFVHALFRQTLYDGMSLTRRQRLHQRAAAAVRSAGGDPIDVANHLLLAAAAAPTGEVCEAVVTAARDAMARTGYEAAVSLCSRAVSILEGRTTDPDRLAVLAARAEARGVLGQVTEGLADALAAAELAERIGDVDTMAEVLTHWCRTSPNVSIQPQLIELSLRCLERLRPGDSISHARLLAAICRQMLYAEPLYHLQRRALEAYEMAHRLGDPVTIGFAATAYREVSDSLPLAERRHDVLDAIEATANVYDDRTWRIVSLRHSLIVAFERGDRAAFDTVLDEYETRARTEHFTSGMAASLRARASIALCAGRFGEAETLGSEAFRLAPTEIVSQSGLLFTVYRERGRLAELEPAVGVLMEQYPHVITWRIVNMGFALELGRLPDVLDELTVLADDGFAALHGALAMPADVAVLSDVAVASGDPTVVKALYDLVLRWSGQNLTIEEFLCLGASDRYLASLEAALGRLDDAVDRYERAIEFDDDFGSGLWAAYGRLGLARALIERGDPADRDRVEGLFAAAGTVAEQTGSVRLRNWIDEARGQTAPPPR